jgi:hypothetical protein
MEALNEFVQWALSLETDSLITTWVKANAIISGAVGTVVGYFIKRYYDRTKNGYNL